MPVDCFGLKTPTPGRKSEPATQERARNALQNKAPPPLDASARLCARAQMHKLYKIKRAHDFDMINF